MLIQTDEAFIDPVNNTIEATKILLADSSEDARHKRDVSFSDPVVKKPSGVYDINQSETNSFDKNNTMDDANLVHSNRSKGLDALYLDD
jgi:hypothetical protein